MTKPMAAEVSLVPRFMSTARVARMLDVSSHTVVRLIERGQLEAVKVGAQWRVKRDSLMVMLGITDGKDGVADA